MSRHPEIHRLHRVGWLRAIVLGANDGIVSIASLVLGVVGADAAGPVLLAGLVGLVGGALSMAVGEYVSVSSQADAERADIARERWELEAEPDAELREMQGIWMKRGLDAETAKEVARQLHAHDALGAHLRDELGITEVLRARPLQAALASAGAFSVGGALPVGMAAVLPPELRGMGVALTCVAALVALGVLSSRLGGAPVLRGTLRVAFGGGLAMALTFGLGTLFGVAV
ncbi:MAG: VIT family protein [Alphaproteobacteria bacterium]|nr:VIT family protein [Alphaproteobacteria bacterium]